MNRTIYLRNGQQPDEAIERALRDSGCFVEHTHTIVETLRAIYDFSEDNRHLDKSLASMLLVVAEVQCGGIPLLMVMREELRDPPSVLLLDRSSDNIRAAVQALQLGASEYLLSSDSAQFRAERTIALIERMRSIESQPLRETDELVKMAEGAASIDGVDWDPVANRIMVDDSEVHLTPIQARIFDRLWVNRNATVSTEDLVRLVLLRDDVNLREGSRLLRPHLVRLRAALDHHPKLAHRIVNIRGSGYMLI